MTVLKFFINKIKFLEAQEASLDKSTFVSVAFKKKKRKKSFGNASFVHILPKDKEGESGFQIDESSFFPS